MSDEERNAWASVNVMGWKLCNRRDMGWGDGPPVWSTGEDPDDPASSPTFQNPDFARNPRHDYMVLQRVRDGWAGDYRAPGFASALLKIQTRAAMRIGSGGYGGCFYEPGQYAAAAFVASGGRLE